MFLPLGRFDWLRKHIGFTWVPGCPDHGSLTLIRVYDEAGNVIETHARACGRVQGAVARLFASGQAREQTAFRLALAGIHR